MSGSLTLILKILAFLLTCFTSVVYSQQRPQYTQYVLNNFLLNPALSGIENYTDVKLGHRQQWLGLQDAPKTSFITANFALGNGYSWKNPLSLDGDEQDPRGWNYQQNYTASPAHHGLGFTAIVDKAAKLSTTTLNITYAYHLPLSGTTNLAVGIAAGATQLNIDINALILENPIDPILADASHTRLNPDLSLGLWFYGARFFAGLSAQQIIPQKLSFNVSQTGKQVAHYFLTTGYKQPLGEDFSVLPSVLVKVVGNLPTSVDVNAKLNFRNKVWLGVGYRNGDALNMMLGVNVNHQFNLTYAYDYTTSKLKGPSTGSHELVLGVLLNNVYKVVCPQKMW